MNITLGQTQVGMMNPPNEGTVNDGDSTWNIKRNSDGMIVLRDPQTNACHPEFLNGMSMIGFCCWINERVQ